MADVRRPVVLVLTAYEPVTWNVEAPKGAVVRVIASGYHKQTVEGLDRNVPVTLISHEAGDEDSFFAFRKEAGPDDGEHERAETKKQYERLVERVRELTKEDIKEFRGDYAGGSYEIK